VGFSFGLLRSASHSIPWEQPQQNRAGANRAEPRLPSAAHRRRAALGVGKSNVTLRLSNVTLNVIFSWSAGCWSHTDPLAVKVDAPRRRLGWCPFEHGSFLASPSGLRFSLSLRSFP
jgi:hypothetical protein